MRNRKEYLSNLINNLIRKNHYADVWDRTRTGEEFLSFVKTDLRADDISVMRPETLGRVMASFAIGDVMAGRAELFGQLHFSGDCEELLRELVALCLAYAICERFLRPVRTVSE